MGADNRSKEKGRSNSIFGLPTEFMANPVDAWQRALGGMQQVFRLHQALTANTNRSRKTGSGARNLYDPVQALIAEAGGRTLRDVASEAGNRERPGKAATAALDLMLQPFFTFTQARGEGQKTLQAPPHEESEVQYGYMDYVMYCSAAFPYLGRFFHSGECPQQLLAILVPIVSFAKAIRSEEVENRPGSILAMHMLLLGFGDEFFKIIRTYDNVFRDFYPTPDSWPTLADAPYPENPEELDQFLLERMGYSGFATQLTQRAPALHSPIRQQVLGLSRVIYISRNFQRALGAALDEHCVSRVKHQLAELYALVSDIDEVLGNSCVRDELPPPEFAEFCLSDRPLHGSDELVSAFQIFQEHSALHQFAVGADSIRESLDEVKRGLAEIRELTAVGSLQNLARVQELVSKIEPVRVYLTDASSQCAQQILRCQRAFQALEAAIDAAYAAQGAELVDAPSGEAGEVHRLRCVVDALEDDKRRIREDLTALREQNFKLKERLKLQGNMASAVMPTPSAITREHLQRLTEIDDCTVLEVMELYAQMYPSVVLLDSVAESAAKMAGFNQGKRLARILDITINDYLPLFLEGGDNKARGCLGGIYAAKESDTVRNSDQARSQREFIFEGEKRLFERHLRVGFGTGQRSLRLYFDVIEGKLVFAYAGEHLDCHSTN